MDIALSCSDCGSRNYKTTKAAIEGSPPLKLKKFCTHCNKHTLHIEGK
jgi:large subunit ribosomal protein L33